MTAAPSDMRAERGEPEPPSDETRAALPEIIHLPYEPPPPPEPPAAAPGKPRRSGRMKGRHFGPRPVDDPRTRRIFVRVTPAQLAALKAAAQEVGLSVSAFVCLRTLGDPGPRALRHKPGGDRALRAQLMAALGRSGNNVNQLLRRVGAYDFTGQPELLAMQEVMAAAHRAHHELVAAIIAEKPGSERALRPQLIAALDQSGNELNQLLRRVNAYDFRGIPELLDMREAMTAAHRAHHELVAASSAEMGY
jgi:uncharacterized protein with GYD domain